MHDQDLGLTGWIHSKGHLVFFIGRAKDTSNNVDPILMNQPVFFDRAYKQGWINMGSTFMGHKGNRHPGLGLMCLRFPHVGCVLKGNHKELLPFCWVG